MDDGGGGNDNINHRFAPQQQQQQQPHRPLLQLIDEEEWFNLYGLRPAGHDDETADENESDRETANNVALELSYQKKIHAKIFEEEDTTASETKQMRSSLQQLERWKEETIDIPTTRFPEEEATDDTTDTISLSVRGQTTTIVIRANLGELAARSDTVFAMASNQHLFGNSSNSINANANNTSTTAKQSPLTLSLHEYSTESVKIFLEVLLSPSSPQTTTTTTRTLSSQTTGSSEPFTDILIPPEHVIDCCRLAHYLQCQQLLDSIVDNYLMAPGSIDDTNCRFLCKLADELSLPGLWEASVNHMLSSLDKFDGTNNNNNSNNKSDNNSNSNSNSNESEPKCLWEDLSPALKTEIQALRGILRSSNRKKIYFSTYHEYLGLLAEQHQYYRERLEDAKQGLRVRSEDESNTRAELSALEAQKASNGWYGNSRLDKRIETTKRMLEGLSKGRNYAASKIERQERRVQTLKALWKEQKKVFGGGSQFDEYSPGEHRSNPSFERGRME